MSAWFIAVIPAFGLGGLHRSYPVQKWNGSDSLKRSR